MGTDIHGFVECALEESGWTAAIDLGLLYWGRSYDAFGCLFGVRNLARFRPLAEGRGIPEDASAEVRERHAGLGLDAHSASWLGWAEIARIGWDERATAVDSRIREYQRTEDGWALRSKTTYDSHLAKIIRRSLDPDPGSAFRYTEHEWPEGSEWRDGEDRLYRVERMTRREAVPPDGEWQPVWKIMEALATLHGAEGVRLVVWFDC